MTDRDISLFSRPSVSAWLASAPPRPKRSKPSTASASSTTRKADCGGRRRNRPRARPQDRRRRHRGRARRLQLPGDVAVDKAGNIYILDSGNARIQKFGPDGKYLATIGRKGQGPGEFILPDGLDIDKRRQPRRRRFGPVAAPRHHRRREGRAGHHPQGRAPLRRPMPGRRRLRRPGLDLGLPDARPGHPEDRRHAPVPAPGAGRADHGLVRDTDDFGETMTNGFGNTTEFDVNAQGRDYRGLHAQNRVEKFGAEGKPPLAGRPASQLRREG